MVAVATPLCRLPLRHRYVDAAAVLVVAVAALGAGCAGAPVRPAHPPRAVTTLWNPLGTLLAGAVSRMAAARLASGRLWNGDHPSR